MNPHALRQADLAENLGLRPLTRWGVLIEAEGIRLAAVPPNFDESLAIAAEARDALARPVKAQALPESSASLYAEHGDCWEATAGSARLSLARLFGASGGEPQRAVLLAAGRRSVQLPSLLSPLAAHALRSQLAGFRRFELNDTREAAPAFIAGARRPGASEWVRSHSLVDAARRLSRPGRVRAPQPVPSSVAS